MNDLVDFLTLRNMQYNYHEFLQSYKTKDKALESMSRIYPSRCMPALKAWVEETEIPFDGEEVCNGVHTSTV
tara:strand:+ start:458 stop:673 length:216 start_codon:yes stop_codon:yes gene_type:complete